MLRNTGAAIKLRRGWCLEQIHDDLGYGEVTVTRALVKALQAENARKEASYHNQRRKRGR
jgi:hypothetical protein